MAAAAAAQLPEFAFAASPNRGVAGYGKDPDLLKAYAAGDLWPLTMSESQRRTTRVLCDLIIPADERSPAASAVATHQFIDEWISAPYPDCRRDRDVVLAGLAWLDKDSQRRYRREFADLESEQIDRVCNDVADLPDPQSPLAQPAAFFRRFRELTAIGYYTTPVGMKALGYVGNEPLVAFDGPPAEVLKRLGLD